MVVVVVVGGVLRYLAEAGTWAKWIEGGFSRRAGPIWYDSLEVCDTRVTGSQTGSLTKLRGSRLIIFAKVEKGASRTSQHRTRQPGEPFR